ncbi:MAG TPA: hypothetical protein VNY84_09525 [Acidimicrobiales bacterium]|jgi:hypothetical protein|nr:hypothetical protein [Acidimicrobiales bacterium]
MKISFRSYAAYSIGCAMVWAVILAVIMATANGNTRHTFLLVFLGWAIAWTSATIARNVYPPPKSWKLVNEGT